MPVHPAILKHVLICDEVQFMIVGVTSYIITHVCLSCDQHVLVCGEVHLPQHTYRPSSFHCSATSYFQHCLLVNVW